MPPPMIVELEVWPEPSPGLGYRTVRSQVHVLIFHAAPQTLHKHVIKPTTPAVHADLNPMSLQYRGKRICRELAALVSVEDLRRAELAKGLLQGRYAERGVQRVGQSPRQHPP